VARAVAVVDARGAVLARRVAAIGRGGHVRLADAHWLAHPQFSAAVADFLQREGHGIAAYVDELREHSPFKTGA
jgi:predicted N-acyltransferase